MTSKKFQETHIGSIYCQSSLFVVKVND